MKKSQAKRIRDGSFTAGKSVKITTKITIMQLGRYKHAFLYIYVKD